MSLFEINVNGKIGFINEEGALRIKPAFLNAFKFSEGLAFAGIKIGEQEVSGFIDESGEWVIDPIYSSNSFYSMFSTVYFY